MKNLTGVVLCGGMSSRMGTDKGMIMQGGKTWAEETYSRLTFFSVPVFVSVNHSQIENYKNYFPSGIIIEDNVKAKGPLTGILSIHKCRPSDDLFVLACDMPLMKLDILYRIYQIYLFNKDSYDFFTFKKDDAFEPLAGIYTAKGLSRIWEMNENGELRGYGMRNILAAGKTFGVPIYKNEQAAFDNFNIPEQTKALFEF